MLTRPESSNIHIRIETYGKYVLFWDKLILFISVCSVTIKLTEIPINTVNTIFYVLVFLFSMTFKISG